MYGLKQTTAPTIWALTTAEAKSHLRVTSDDEDTHIASLVKAATMLIDEYTGRQSGQATWKLYLDRFPCGTEPIELPRPPLSSVTSVVYQDATNATTTWATSNYAVSNGREPGRISLVYGAYYPTTYPQNEAVTITYVAGYGTAETSIDERIRHACRLLVGNWFANREAVVVGSPPAELPLAVQSLLDSLRVGDEFTCYGRERIYG